MAANWKMHKTTREAATFAGDFLPRVKEAAHVDVVLAPPFTALATLAAALDGSPVTLSAQNVNPEEKGAFTGEVAPGMLAELGCRYTIVGHSERRSLYGEDDALVARKARALFEAGIVPIVCVGETLEERESDRAFEVIGSQLARSLAEVPAERAGQVVVAYEPVWAIGTGRTATPETAQEVHAFVRERLGAQLGTQAADRIRIQYGGSVKPDNVDSLMAQPDIDGALVGGAGLDPESFARIVNFEQAGS
jgi:triosephosphate isomerase